MSIQMFCLPYAGGSASVYNDWKKTLSGDFDVIPMEYAGHGNRFCDDFFESIEEAACDIGDKIMKQAKGDYIIYGHSMGCLVALELAYYFKKNNFNMPKAIIVAATRPPHLMYRDKDLGSLSKDDLMKEIGDLGQMEAEVFEEPELYELISEILYADIQMFSKYQRNFDEKVDVPLVALYGVKDDEAPREDMMEWSKYTENEFELNEFKGDHFFAFNDNDEFMEFIKKFS